MDELTKLSKKHHVVFFDPEETQMFLVIPLANAPSKEVRASWFKHGITSSTLTNDTKVAKVVELEEHPTKMFLKNFSIFRFLQEAIKELSIDIMDAPRSSGRFDEMFSELMKQWDEVHANTKFASIKNPIVELVVFDITSK